MKHTTFLMKSSLIYALQIYKFQLLRPNSLLFFILYACVCRMNRTNMERQGRKVLILVTHKKTQSGIQIMLIS